MPNGPDTTAIGVGAVSSSLSSETTQVRRVALGGMTRFRDLSPLTCARGAGDDRPTGPDGRPCVRKEILVPRTRLAPRT